MKKVLNILFWISIIVGLNACSATKFLNEGETLYTGIDIKFENPELVDNESALKQVIKDELYPKPADKFLGIAYTRQWIYAKVNPKPGKTSGFKYKLKYKFGEKPVLLSDINTDLMNNINAKTMQDNGFFKCSSSSKEESKNRKVNIVYTISNGRPSNIDSIIFPSTGTEIETILAQYPYLRIKIGQRYNLEDFTNDREDLATYIRNSGFYEFGQNDLFFLLDTSGKSPDFDVYFKIKPPKNDSIHRKFYIRNVNIYVTNENTINPDSTKYTSKTIRGINIHHQFSFISDKTVYANTLIEPNHAFSIDAFNYTSGRFINMNIFDFVNINYSKIGNDKLDVDIILNPTLTESFSAGIEANTSNRSFLGGSVNATYTNKNTNKKADKFVATTSFGSELQNVDESTQFNIFNYGVQLKFEVPRLFFFLNTGKLPSEQAPVTYTAFNYNHQAWLQYYSLNSVDISYGYEWTNATRFHHEIKPFTFNLIDVQSTTKTFQKTLDENPLLAVSFMDQIIMGSQYLFSLNTKKKPDQKAYFHFQNSFESAGNKSWVVSKLIKPNAIGAYEMFNVPYAQFLKNEVVLRFHNDITKDRSFVARVEVGAGFAYANSNTLPFTKKFFIGGPNTIRGFRFRSLGPGSYALKDGNMVNPIEQSGDMRLLFNAEYRFPIYSMFKGAFFADAGNIWLLSNDPERPTGLFKLERFIEQLAFSSGFGLRLDLGFFVIRGDLGVALYKPYLTPDERWITNSNTNSFKDWRKQNTVFNVAIGYPF